MTSQNDPDLSAIKQHFTSSTPLGEVFYKGQWMNIPMPFIPSNGKMKEPSEEDQTSVGPDHVASVVPYLFNYRTLLRLCREQDIPFYWVTGLLPPRSSKDKVSGRSSRKSSRVSGKEFRAFIRFLPRAVRLMAELYWFINKKIKLIGLLYGWEELCFMRIEAVPEVDGDFPPVIHFSRTRRHGARGERFIAHYVPAPLVRKIRQNMLPHSPLVFCQKNGAPFTTTRLTKEFSKASKAAKHAHLISRDISLRDLRDSINMTDEMLDKIGRKNRERIFHEISNEQLEKIQQLISRNAGAKSCFSLRLIIQAICYHDQFGCAWAKLPEEFPPWRAVKSQHARWKGRGILKEILQIALPKQL